MVRGLYAAGVVAAAALLITSAPAHAGALIINDVGSISDANVLGAINTAVSNVESLYSTGTGAGNVTLNVDFTYSGAASGTLASSNQYVYTYGYSQYVGALTSDSAANANNTNLATAVAYLAGGNSGPVAVTYGQALLLSQYGLTAPSFQANDAVNLNSNVTNWNFSGSTTASQFDAIGSIEHELDELLGIGGGGSFLGGSTPTMGATDLYRYSAPGSPSLSTTGTYMSINGGATKIVAFNGNSAGDYGDFAPSCGPSSNNVNGNQYIQNALNCTGGDENYTTASPEYVAATSVGWSPTASAVALPEPSSMDLLGTALFAFAGVIGLKVTREPGRVSPPSED